MKEVALTVVHILVILCPSLDEAPAWRSPEFTPEVGGFSLNVILNRINNMTYRQKLLYIIVAFCFIVSIAFVYNNYSFYDRPIAQVIETNMEDTSEVTDQHHNKDKLFMQHIVAEVKNGEKKGQLIHLTNEYSSSGAYDQPYQSGNELFISIDKSKEKN